MKIDEKINLPKTFGNVTYDKLILDRDKVLDEAIFWLIEARRKVREGFGINASARASMGIEKAQKFIDKIDNITDRHQYPTTEVLVNQEYISIESEYNIGDNIAFVIIGDFGSTVKMRIGKIAKIIDNNNYKIQYQGENRKSTVNRHKDSITKVFL